MKISLVIFNLNIYIIITSHWSAVHVIFILNYEMETYSYNFFLSKIPIIKYPFNILVYWFLKNIIHLQLQLKWNQISTKFVNSTKYRKNNIRAWHY